MNHNKTRYCLLFSLLLSMSFSVFGINGGNGGKEKDKGSPKPSAEQPLPNSPRTFPGDESLAPLVFESVSDPIDVTYHPNAAAEADVKRAHDLFDYVIRENRLTDFLSDGALQSLPVGVRKMIGGKEYIIVIDSMVLTPTAAYLVAYMSLPVPQSEQRLAFKGSNIRFTKTGGLTGNVRLTLLEDLSIPISNHAQFNMLSENGNTFIDWDCNGFKSMGLNAEVEFSRDYLVPDKEDGSVGEGRVKGNFKTVINDWSDLIAEITLSPFQVTKLKGFGFYVNKAVFDFSDLNNAPGLEFPAAYSSTMMMEGNAELWQGFYLKELQIRLPLQFSSRNGGRKQIEGHNLFIDNLGFSGTLAAKRMLSLEEGTMSGWKFSLDSIGVNLVTNEIRAAAFTGQLHVPVFKDGQLFSYTASITAENDYLFTVKNDSTMQMSLFAAKAVIDKNSYLEINVIDGVFKPKAVLNGTLTISAGMSDKADGARTSIGGVTFEALEISTVSPYISVGAFSLGSESTTPKVANFPVSLEHISLDVHGKDVNLSFDIVVSLVGSGAGGFGAKGGLILKSEVEYKDNLSFKFTGVDLTELAVKIDGGAYKIEGSLQLFKDDATYGNGIRGTVSASFQPGLEVQALALFGTVNGDRYWFADALAKFNSGVVVFPGFAIYGFGGGVYYHMKQQGYAATGSNTIGASLSGITYTPDPKTLLGLKATITLGTHPSQEAFNGDATFEISFNNGGGVNQISFIGNAYFAAPPLPRELTNLKKKAELLAKATAQQSPFDDSKGSIYARLLMTFDIPNQTLHGNLTTYANVAGGVVKGAGANNLCGEAVMHFSPTEWYIHIGTPSNRMALSLAGFATLQGYMMVGTKIPGMPDPPAEVSEILWGLDRDRSDDMNALSKGEGFAFGASFSYNTGNLRFLAFYANFAAGAGFDVMLKNYGDDMRCDGSSGPIGINGWYATGQAYGYFRGSIGITVDLYFYSDDFEILSISAAVLLKAKLPNPIFLQGTVGGSFSILGGMVSGRCQFQMTIGEQCQVRNSALEGERIIAAVTPATNEKNVDVFTAAQAVFNMSIDQEFEFKSMDGTWKYFRGTLALFKLYDGATEIPCILTWNDNRTVAAISPVDVLPSNKGIKIKIKLTFDEKVSGVWRALTVNGAPAVEEREITFNTNTAPDYIPLTNIIYSYPVIGQYNFYPQETTKGYIKLIKGQPEIFKTSADWQQVGRFCTAAGQKIEFPFTYSASNRQIDFTLPSGLVNNTLYAFEIVNMPRATQQAIDANVRETTTLVDNTGVAIRSRTAQGTLTVVKDKSVFTTYVRTSRYNRFIEKMNALSVGKGAYYPLYPDIHQLMAGLKGPELFDRYELQGAANITPLVQIESELADTWYTKYTGPLLYDGYPYNGAVITHRVPTKLGVPPVRAVYLDQPNREQVVSQAEITDNFLSGTDAEGVIIHDMVFEAYYDFYELKQRAGYLAQSRNDPWITRLLTGKFKQLMPGTYKIRFRYVLPGTNEITSEVSKTITLN